jgi:hypothetical protein
LAALDKFPAAFFNDIQRDFDLLGERDLQYQDFWL